MAITLNEVAAETLLTRGGVLALVGVVITVVSLVPPRGTWTVQGTKNHNRFGNPNTEPLHCRLI